MTVATTAVFFAETAANVFYNSYKVYLFEA